MLDALFSPLAIGPVTIRNRIVSTSHQTSLVHNHLPTADLVAYHEARARGGVGLICLEATAVHHTGLLTAHTVGGYLPEIVPAYRRLGEAVHAHDTRLFVQLFHGGREMIAAAPRPPAVAPSSVPSARFKTEPRALTRREIGEMIDGYRQAGRLAAQGGVDGLEVCAGFGYLPTQFLSERINRRTDEYGGSFENRVRFLCEVCAAMREGIGPGGAVGARLTDEHLFSEGNSLDELQAAAALLVEQGLVDYISAAIGHSSSYRGSSWIVPPAPVEHNAAAGFARGLREACGGVMIATSRVVDPAEADAMIGRGDCDAVGMTRALITDPSMPGRARRGEAFTACIGCNQGCIGHYHQGLPIACTINPWTGYERRLARPQPAESAQTWAIVGAGPAGAAAAGAAQARGHRVIVFEQAEAAGGQMRLALGAPGHAEIANGLLRTIEGWLVGCELRLGVRADAEEVLAARPDRVLLATGAVAHLPDLPGAGPAVLAAWQVLAGGGTGHHVVVADWGGEWTGLAVAEELASRGCAVRLVTSAAAVGETIHQYQRNMYLARLDEAGVELVHHLEPVMLDGDGVLFRNVFSGRELRLGGIDTLVVSAGRAPDDALFGELAEHGVEAVRIGDVLSPRSFEEAIREGTEAGLETVAAPLALH